MSQPRSGPGRPVDMGKREAIIEAARGLLLQHGQPVSLEAVAASAKVSRQTIYNSWPNKESLFASVIEQTVDRLLEPLTSASEDVSIEETLIQFGANYLNAITDTDRVNLLRAILSDLGDHGSAFYQAGPARSQAALATYLEQQVKRGLLDIEAPMRAAEQFLGMLKGNVHLRALLRLPTFLSDQEKQQWIAEAVAMFLRAYQSKTTNNKKT